ncbi:MAG: acyl-CoA dehydrogenase family protein [Bacteroidia bacterium]|nr:acyl-CoA dehydrogenase family protein [Bacteroidia bacterium]
MEATVKKNLLGGGEFLIKESAPQDVFTPEDFDEESRMMADMCQDFLDTEVTPLHGRLDSMKELDLMPGLLNKAGELGMLGISIPEEYGGFGKDFNTSMYLTEKVGAGHSFAVAFAAHTGIGTLPLLYFGTDAQKDKYLSKLASGEWKASYCLTEPGSGSDALAAKSTAVLSDDGKHYILNGQKIWITNGGFADLFTVFAKIDGDKFTGFLVERSSEGVSLGDEEHKMGIKGSSTRAVFFQDVKVPVENVLGEIGRGHVIAFNILNIGRIKLAAAAMGAAKKATTETVKYAMEREQFKTPIANFGAIKYKMAEQAIRLYACDATTYRASGDIQTKEHELQAGGMAHSEALLAAAEEYAIECAMLKVFGSEVLDYVVDEGVQVFGGNGFSADYPMDRNYRDSRINRIFEGTNEINRLLSVDMILKRAMKGQINLMGAAMEVQKELTGVPSFGDQPEGLLGKELKYLSNFKKSILMAAGAAVQKFMMGMKDEQEVIMNLADMLMYTYAAESTVLRTLKLAAVKGEAAVARQIEMTQVYVYDTADRINKAGKDCINSFAEGDLQRMLLLGLKRYTKVDPINVKEYRRNIAHALMEAGGYCF